MRLRLIILNVMLLRVAFTSPAQQMDLDSILILVEKNNPELSVFDSRIRAYNEYAKGARALDPPQVGGGFFMTPYNPQMWGSDEMSGSPGMGSFMVSAQQMFMNAKKRNANATYMQSMSGVDSTMKLSMRNEMFAMTKMAYYELLVMQKKMVVLESSEKLLNYLVQSTELRYTYGMDKLNAYYKAKAMLGEMQTMKLMTEQEIATNKAILNTLMNREPTSRLEIDTSYTIHSYESMPADSSALFSNRSDFRSFNKQINLLKSKSDYENSKRYPDFGLRFDHMIPFGTQPQQFSLMVMFAIPIAPWSSKMYEANVKGIKFEIDAVKVQQRSLYNKTKGELEKIKIQLSTKKQQLELTEKTILPAMKKNYETELLAYEQNTEMLFMVLDAWQSLKLSQLTYLDQLMQLLALQIQFEKQMEIK